MRKEVALGREQRRTWHSTASYQLPSCTAAYLMRNLGRSPLVGGTYRGWLIGACVSTGPVLQASSRSATTLVWKLDPWEMMQAEQQYYSWAASVLVTARRADGCIHMASLLCRLPALSPRLHCHVAASDVLSFERWKSV